ncbi:ABC transporter substrate-binding protein [Pontibaca salina]|uniref:ABC transporter substrate-binding protein n=1 Tax=Pontibaca salina TaxID=2795731 RepID=A0A934HT10_9RHOB|nr:ABC transporter substrate-binding protein [Pontibaca salina]MBI6629079.1 ABC transporter substrate-binding protein [Pontibaca salina]
MRKLFLATTAAMALAAGFASAEEVKMGVALGFTGPLESLSPPMANGAELAAKEISDSGKFMDGSTVTTIRADTTCIDASAATAAAERLVTSDRVAGIMGAMCSGATGAVLQNVAIPNGVVMISPSATSPALSTVEDNGYFFRTAPSDARQGVIMAENILDRGIETVAITYTNNDYGKGLADSFAEAYAEKGGTVTINTAHEDGKADYSAEIGSLSSAGGDALVVVGYVDQGGKGIVRAALDSGAFETFVFPDGMISEVLESDFGDEIEGSFGQKPGNESDGLGMFVKLAEEAGFDGNEIFAPESYDAMALMLLAMHSAGSTKADDYKGKIMDIANAPGEKILPGELGKALEILSDGGEVDYQGASAVEFIDPGESAGNYIEMEMKDGKLVTIGVR